MDFLLRVVTASPLDLD